MNKNTRAILTLLYPKISKALDSHPTAFKQVFAKFMNDRHKQLFATGPLDRIAYGTQDGDMLLNALHMDRREIKEAISETYYWNIAAFNPRYAKDEITVLCLCILRYYLLKRDMKNAEMAATYMGFTGKYYPSIHYMAFPKAEPSKYEHVMEYVVNNLSNKYDLKREGNILGTIRSIATTWMNAYPKEFKEFDDEDVTYVIQQLHNRIKSFMKNIAGLYYKAYENKSYITFDGELLTDDEFQLADSDSLRAERVIENSMTRINSMSVDYRFCKMAADTIVKTEEVKSIIESILNDNKNIPDVKELVRLLVYTYFRESKTKDVSDIKFITYSIAPKPNSKDKHINRIKEIVESWLEMSPRYQKRKARLATKNSYFRTVLMYFTLIIHTTNK